MRAPEGSPATALCLPWAKQHLWRIDPWPPAAGFPPGLPQETECRPAWEGPGWSPLGLVRGNGGHRQAVPSPGPLFPESWAVYWS